MQIFKNKGSCDGYLPQDALAFSLVTIAHTANLMTLTILVAPLLSQRITTERKTLTTIVPGVNEAGQLAHPHSFAPGFFFCTRQGSIKAKDKIRYNGVRKNRKGGITMRESKFTSYDDLPLMLSAPEVAEVLGISRAGAYELVSSAGFPHMKIGNRILVPKDKFLK